MRFYHVSWNGAPDFASGDLWLTVHGGNRREEQVLNLNVVRENILNTFPNLTGVVINNCREVSPQEFRINRKSK